MSRVFRFWLELSKEEELRRLLELIRQEFRRRGLFLNYKIQRESQAGQ
ncbi:MAG: hypothetical protein HY726_05870 [Candidatus Rokubacteria bacterium]|nr:hypothetical protein [Candidatus Rokubacteria bacterium]